MYLGELSFDVNFGTSDKGYDCLLMAMPPKQTIRELKENISLSLHIPTDQLNVWRIEYDNGDNIFDIDDSKALVQCTSKDRNISKIFVKQSGFEATKQKLGKFSFGTPNYYNLGL